jgi:hypothetical protein
LWIVTCVSEEHTDFVSRVEECPEDGCNMLIYQESSEHLVVIGFFNMADILQPGILDFLS